MCEITGMRTVGSGYLAIYLIHLITRLHREGSYSGSSTCYDHPHTFDCGVDISRTLCPPEPVCLIYGSYFGYHRCLHDDGFLKQFGMLYYITTFPVFFFAQGSVISILNCSIFSHWRCFRVLFINTFPYPTAREGGHNALANGLQGQRPLQSG